MGPGPGSLEVAIVVISWHTVATTSKMMPSRLSVAGPGAASAAVAAAAGASAAGAAALAS